MSMRSRRSPRVPADGAAHGPEESDSGAARDDGAGSNPSGVAAQPRAASCSSVSRRRKIHAHFDGGGSDDNGVGSLPRHEDDANDDREYDDDRCDLDSKWKKGASSSSSAPSARRHTHHRASNLIRRLANELDRILVRVDNMNRPSRLRFYLVVCAAALTLLRLIKAGSIHAMFHVEKRRLKKGGGWHASHGGASHQAALEAVRDYGEGEHVLAFSLYDGGTNGMLEHDERYNDGALANARLYRDIYGPEWTMRLYHDETVPPELLGRLRELGVELMDMTKHARKNPNGNKMVWRFGAASDPGVGRYCIRDVDSRLSRREKAAVDAWVRSGRKFHVMRDHPSHSQNYMSGGMWCGTRDAFPDMVTKLKSAEVDGTLGEGHMADIDFLTREVWPVAQESGILQHDAYSCEKEFYEGSEPFPTEREGWEHVGAVFVDGRMREGDVEILRDAVQPYACRDGTDNGEGGAVKASDEEEGDAGGWGVDVDAEQEQEQEQEENGGWDDENGSYQQPGGDQNDLGWWGWMFGNGASGGGSDGGGHSDMSGHLDEKSHLHDLDQVAAEMQQQQQQQDHEGPSDSDPSKFCFRRAPAPTDGSTVERQGQVTSDTTFGAALRHLSSQSDVKRVLEIGTWYGGGSTENIVDGLREKSDCDVLEKMQCCGSFVITFEIHAPAWEHARVYHRDNPVWLVHGTTVGVDDMLTEEEIPDEEKGEHYSLYYQRDKDVMAREAPQLEKYCDMISPDVVLIDGNEYTGWGEFNVATKRCKPRYLALHDTGTLKTHKVEEEIRRQPDKYEEVETGKDAAGWGIYKVNYNEKPKEGSFRIVILTANKPDSLRNLLDSLNSAKYGGTFHPLHLDIRIDYDDSPEHERTSEVAEAFEFTHGTKSVHKYVSTQGRQKMWFKAWAPASDDERAVILEDALELSPLWYTWIERAWNEYGSRDDLGAISLCRQRLRASDGEVVTKEWDAGPFLHRVPGSHGFSPKAKEWREFIKWVQSVDDLKNADVDVDGTITTQWHKDGLDTWEQYWVWWCWGIANPLAGSRSLYNLYVHPPETAALIRHEADFDSVPLQQELIPLLTTFPDKVERFDWAFEVEVSGILGWASKLIRKTSSGLTVVSGGTGAGGASTDGGGDGDGDAYKAYNRYGEEPKANTPELTALKASSAIVVWSNDFHVSTIGNVKSLLKRDDVHFIDKSLSGHCDKMRTCATDLRVLNAENGINPDRWTREEFVESYKDDAEMDVADVVVCFHPSSMCEVFMPLKKRLFVVATTRYEMGRHEPDEWNAWNANLKTIAADKTNLVAANNLYDAKYIEYFTGITPVLMPSWKPMKATYTGTSDDIIVAAMHIVDSFNSDEIWQQLGSVSSRFVDLRQKYPTYKFAQLCQNTAVLHIPYQASVMSLFEHYGMGLPIIVPSPEFLWELHERYGVVSERTWDQVKTLIRPSSSAIPGVASGRVPDPNNDLDREAFLHWIRYADYYQWPHVVTFESWDDLKVVLDKTDWKAVSAKMKVYYDDALSRTREEWKTRLRVPPGGFFSRFFSW